MSFNFPLCAVFYSFDVISTWYCSCQNFTRRIRVYGRVAWSVEFGEERKSGVKARLSWLAGREWREELFFDGLCKTVDVYSRVLANAAQSFRSEHLFCVIFTIFRLSILYAMFSDISLSRYRLNSIGEERKRNMEKELVEKRAKLALLKLKLCVHDQRTWTKISIQEICVQLKPTAHGTIFLNGFLARANTEF